MNNLINKPRKRRHASDAYRDKWLLRLIRYGKQMHFRPRDLTQEEFEILLRAGLDTWVPFRSDGVELKLAFCCARLLPGYRWSNAHRKFTHAVEADSPRETEKCRSPIL